MVRRWSNLSTSFKNFGNLSFNFPERYADNCCFGLSSLTDLDYTQNRLVGDNTLAAGFGNRSVIWFKKLYGVRPLTSALLDLFRLNFVRCSSYTTSNLHYFISKYELNLSPLPNQVNFYSTLTGAAFSYLADCDFKILTSLKSNFSLLQTGVDVSSSKAVLKTYQASTSYCLELLSLIFNSLRFKQGLLNLPDTFVYRGLIFFRFMVCLTKAPLFAQLTSQFFLLKRASGKQTLSLKSNYNSAVSLNSAASLVNLLGFYLLNSGIQSIYKFLIRLFCYRFLNV
jgi:hypothetical protein